MITLCIMSKIPAPRCWLLAATLLGLAACTPTALNPFAKSTPQIATSTAVVTESMAQDDSPALLPELFPAPPLRYVTPGLERGRTHFTTMQELSAFLHGLPATVAAPERTGAPLHIVRQDLGRSAQGQPITAVIASRLPQPITPATLLGSPRPTVLFVAGQQGNAPIATEAALALLDELRRPDGLLLPLLESANLIVIPRANPDGFANGQSTTADGTDLTHDHLALRSVEAQALARFIGQWQPAVVVDVGEMPATIAARQGQPEALLRQDMGTQYAHPPGAHELITRAAQQWFHTPLQSDLQRAGLVPGRITLSTVSTAAALRTDTLAPVTLANTAALRYAVGLTLRSRGNDLDYAHAQRRTFSHVQSMLSILGSAGQRGADLYKLRDYLVRDTASQACRGEFTSSAQPRLEEWDTTLVDPATHTVQTQRLRWLNASEHTRPMQRVRPCGYWLAKSAQPALQRLLVLGAQSQTVAEAAQVVVDGYFDAQLLETSAPVSKAEASQPATVAEIALRQSQHITMRRSLSHASAGSYYLPVHHAQYPGLLSAALELDTPWSYYRQGVLLRLDESARIMAPPPLVFTDD